MKQGAQLVLGDGALTSEGIVAVAGGRVRVSLSEAPAFQARLEQGAAVVQRRLEQRVPTYGINTGFGAACGNAVAPEHAAALTRNLPEYHGCGVGPHLDPASCRAVMIVRMASLSHGYSGVRPLLLARMAEVLNAGLAPVIPARGSVGASGDLTPLSYVAAALEGRREMWRDGERVASEDALREAGIEPLRLAPKESLALMNGTSVMAALSVLALVRAERLSRVACLATAMASQAMRGQTGHFDARIFEAKGHLGQAQCAAWIRAALGVGDRPGLHDGRIQDPYSLRCAPHVIGVLVDSAPFFHRVLETEINGASDNPLFDPETGDALHGGNFYGGHVAMVADSLKTAVANVADLLDRQVVLLNDPARNGGLPENLRGVPGEAASAHHGFKAMEITASALTAEALSRCMPSSVFSRSTEGHNQDKVSMGTIAARSCLEVVELTEQVLAVQLLAACQALELGQRAGSPVVRGALACLRRHADRVEADRPMDADIARVTALLRDGDLGELTGEGGP